jgi:hypothetical protein
MQIQKGKIEIAGGEQSFVLQYLGRIIIILLFAFLSNQKNLWIMMTS